MLTDSETCEFVFKIIVIGAAGVGKTNIIMKETQDLFELNTRATLGPSFAEKIFNCSNGVNVKVHIWDTAGQERFASLTRPYFRDSHGCLLVYSVDQEDSFGSLERYLSQLKLEASDCHVMLVGNKIDLERRVSYNQAEEFAKDKSISYIEVSALDGTNVHKAFTQLIEEIVAHYKLISSVPNYAKQGLNILSNEPRNTTCRC
eukprot:TRINITY_DN10722_c0_g1_i1.p1 TRINITY_DN10722_c0_g1~~TRINITY_DN10722_c0_g1_i1.p1  ORF type:complete len:203 (-),score=25.17 TRINITY_DN10722_c0_g1_i1:25-633(-)